MTRILLTGNKGFIGKNLEPKLRELGHSIQGMDLRDSERYFDIRVEQNVFDIMKSFEPDIVIHLAARTGVRQSLIEPLDYFETNIGGTYNLLSEAVKCGCKRFLFASSSSVYGGHFPPLREDMECNNQLSPYAVSKKAGEMFCRMFSKLPTTVIRPFTVYGLNGREEMVIQKIIKAGRTGGVFEKYGSGKSVRGYIHVDDLCDGIIKLLDYKPEDNFDIINLGGSEQISLDRLIEIVREEFPKLKIKQVPGSPADMGRNFADMSKVEEKVGFKPVKDFKTEIKKLC